MNKGAFKNLLRKPAECYVPNIIVHYLNSDYRLELDINALVNRENGFLKIAELVSKEKRFVFRWDERDKDGAKIDVDLWLSDKLIKNFKGHHSRQITEPPNRCYFFNIFDLENKKIFEGIFVVVIKTENTITKPLEYCIKNN